MIPEVDALARKLEAERTKLINVLESANEAQRAHLIYDEGWTLHDLVSHIASAEKENVRFLAETLAKDGARHLPAEHVFSLDEWNARAVGKRKHLAWEERMAELREARRNTLDLLGSVVEDQFYHRGTHAVWGEKDIASLIKILYLHDIMHRNDVVRRLKA